MIARLVWTTWTLMSAVPKKAVKLTHSHTLSFSVWWLVCNPLARLGHWNKWRRWEERWMTSSLLQSGRRTKWLCLYCKVGGELNDFVSTAKWEESWMTSSLLRSGRRAELLRLYCKVGGELNDFVSTAKWEESWMTSSLLQSGRGAEWLRLYCKVSPLCEYLIWQCWWS